MVNPLLVLSKAVKTISTTLAMLFIHLRRFFVVFFHADVSDVKVQRKIKRAEIQQVCRKDFVAGRQPVKRHHCSLVLQETS
jgi:hypothetical protein